MTGQIHDTIEYKGCDWSLIGLGGGKLPCPTDYGIQADMESTALRRGYLNMYRISDDRLTLVTMSIYLSNHDYPEIEGIEPDVCEYEASMRSYRFERPEEFTGTLRLGRELDYDHYIHMGFQKASAFKQVIELDFEHGAIASERDMTEDVLSAQGRYKKHFHEFARENCEKAIDESFSLDLDLI